MSGWNKRQCISLSKPSRDGWEGLYWERDVENWRVGGNGECYEENC